MRRRLLTVIALAAAMVGGACSEPSATLPADMMGKWTTDYARYAERFIEIEATHIEFGTGGSSSTRHLIVYVSAEPGDHGTLYTIQYQETPEVTGTFGVFLDRSAGAVLRLENQPGFAWTREGA